MTQDKYETLRSILNHALEEYKSVYVTKAKAVNGIMNQITDLLGDTYDELLMTDRLRIEEFAEENESQRKLLKIEFTD